MAHISAQALVQNFVDKLPEFSGETISDLVSTVEAAEGQKPSPESQPRPALPLTPDGCNYFVLKELPPGSQLPCATVDCDRQAAVFQDDRDGELQPLCAKCAYVEFAMWMVGI